jgi:cobalt-zinc-cadmium efflux system protein
MESTPADINMDDLRRDMLAVEGVRGVHDLHVWSITSQLRYLSAHIVTEDVTVSVGAKVQAAVGQMLADRHEVRHATLQLECEECDHNGLFCDCADPHA